jgi:hypothetical protein
MEKTGPALWAYSFLIGCCRFGREEKYKLAFREGFTEIDNLRAV